MSSIAAGKPVLDDGTALGGTRLRIAAEFTARAVAEYQAASQRLDEAFAECGGDEELEHWANEVGRSKDSAGVAAVRLVLGWSHTARAVGPFHLEEYTLPPFAVCFGGKMYLVIDRDLEEADDPPQRNPGSQEMVLLEIPLTSIIDLDPYLTSDLPTSS